MQVTIIIAARYVVRKGWIGKVAGWFETSCGFSEASFSAVLGWRGGLAFCWPRGREVLKSTKMAGEATRRFSSNGADEYKVVANRMPVTFSRKSTASAAAL